MRFLIERKIPRTGEERSIRVLKKIGWALFLAILFCVMPLPEVAAGIQALAAAHCASWVTLAGLGRASRVPWMASVEQLLLRWLALTIGILGLYWSGMVRSGGPEVLHLICGMGHVLFLSLFNLAKIHRARRAMLAELHIPLLAAVVLFGSLISPVNAASVLLVSLLILGLLSLRVLGGAVQSSKTLRRDPTNGFFAQGGVVILRYADILVLPWLLDPRWVLPYLLARGMSEGIQLGLAALAQGAAPALLRARQADEKRALAARINLGALLIGGALMIVTLWLGRLGSIIPWPGFQDLAQVLPWLVFASAGPAIFGLTHLFLPHFGGWRFQAASGWGATALFCVGALVFPIGSATDLAVVYAVAKLAHNLICAVSLGIKSGVWPGVTALLFRQIKVK